MSSGHLLCAKPYFMRKLFMVIDSWENDQYKEIWVYSNETSMP